LLFKEKEGLELKLKDSETLQEQYNSIFREKEDLELKLKNLETLQEQYNSLSKEKEGLESKLNISSLFTTNLKTKYDSLSKEKESVDAKLKAVELQKENIIKILYDLNLVNSNDWNTVKDNLKNVLSSAVEERNMLKEQLAQNIKNNDTELKQYSLMVQDLNRKLEKITDEKNKLGLENQDKINKLSQIELDLKLKVATLNSQHEENKQTIIKLQNEINELKIDNNNIKKIKNEMD